MKKFCIITLCLLGAFNISAASKFYLNPGHGGQDYNDRPTPLRLGVVIFYESDVIPTVVWRGKIYCKYGHS